MTTIQSLYNNFYTDVDVIFTLQKGDDQFVIGQTEDLEYIMRNTGHPEQEILLTTKEMMYLQVNTFKNSGWIVEDYR